MTVVRSPKRLGADGLADRRGGSARDVALGGLVELAIGQNLAHRPLNGRPLRPPYEKYRLNARQNGVSGMSGGKRRLAGILAADVVGYSAMVAADEPASLARVRALRTEIIEPAAAAHDGRLFKTMGDGFLLEFASAVQALQCAIAIQTTLNAQPDGLRLRIGAQGRLGGVSRSSERSVSSAA